MGCGGEFRDKVRNKVIKVIHSEGEGYKAESLFWGEPKKKESWGTTMLYTKGEV